MSDEYIRNLISDVKNRKHNSHNSFEELINHYSNIIYNFIKIKITNSEDVNDIYQETIMGIWKNLDKFNEESNFKTWIISIAKNKINDFFRTSYKIQNFETELTENIAENITFDSVIDALDIHNALAKLKQSERELLFLIYEAGLSYTQIEELTGIKSGTIKSRVSSLKTKLLPLLSVKGGD